MIPASNPNNAWASGTTRRNLPRSTSVEYEKETQTTYLRRFAHPRPSSRPPLSRRPTSKNLSAPDSEGENAANTSASATRRGKSPFEHVVDAAKNILEPATYYVRQLSLELEDRSNSSNGNTVNNISYDYSTEEREFEDSQQPRGPVPIQRRGRIPLDNRAYEPPVSEIESADEDYSDDDKRRKRRKKKKNDLVGGPLTTLPVLSTDKKKKRKNRGTMSNVTGQDDEESESAEESSIELVRFMYCL